MAMSPEEICAAFVEEMKAAWGNDLVAVVLYGSAARRDFVPGRSGVDFLVLVRDLDPRRLIGLQRNLKRWRRRRISLPLLLKEAGKRLFDKDRLHVHSICQLRNGVEHSLIDRSQIL